MAVGFSRDMWYNYIADRLHPSVASAVVEKPEYDPDHVYAWKPANNYKGWKLIDRGEAGVDDATVIQQAVNQQGLIFIKRGTYIINQTIKIPPKTRIIGELSAKNWEPFVELKADSEFIGTILESEYGYVSEHADLTRDIHIENININGSGSNTAIKLTNVDGGRLVHVRIAGVATGIVNDQYGDPPTENYIKDCVIKVTNTAIKMQYAIQCWIKDNWFVSGITGEYIYLIGCAQIRIQGNEFNQTDSDTATCIRLEDDSIQPILHILATDNLYGPVSGRILTLNITNSSSQRLYITGLTACHNPDPIDDYTTIPQSYAELYGPVKTVNWGTATFTGDGTTKQFQIPHGLVKTPRTVQLTPRTSASYAEHHATVDDTYINVNFTTAPSAETTIAFSWYARW